MIVKSIHYPFVMVDLYLSYCGNALIFKKSSLDHLLCIYKVHLMQRWWPIPELGNSLCLGLTINFILIYLLT